MLRKAMELMALDGAMGNSSLPTLTALSLPGNATPLLWTTRAFLQQRYQKLNNNSLIHHRKPGRTGAVPADGATRYYGLG